MPAKRKYRDAAQVLEKVTGGQLTFRRLIRSTRLAANATLEQFAKRLGVSKQHLSDIESGRKTVSPERAYSWAQKLGEMELQWVELALQDALDKARLPVRVRLEPSREARA
jgi:antitoxin HigA-1